MIIGIDASRANRPHKSGTEWYSYYLIKALAKIDSRNQYILYTDKPLIKELCDLTDEVGPSDCGRIDRGGWQSVASPYNNFKAKILKWPWKFFWTQGRLSWEMLIGSPDILFVPAHALPLIHPAKSVVTIHDIGYKRHRSLYSHEKIGYRPKIWNWLARAVTRGRYQATAYDYLDWSTGRSLKKARHIITISEFSRQEIRRYYETPVEKISVVHNGYNVELFQKKEMDERKIDAALEAHGIEKPYLFYVGRLEKKKNVGALVEAYVLARHRGGWSHKLYLVGDASFGYDEIKYLINEFDVANQVLTTGWVSEEHLSYIYHGATAFIFPTKYEGFGIPLLQAMAAGTPVVASRAAAVPEIAGDAALLFDPDDVEDMAEKINKIVTGEALRERLIAAGRERVKQFSWEKCARETLKVFNGL